MMNKINAVCVYSASSTKIDSVYFETAHELGTLLAQNGIRVVNGAGNMGLMAAVSDATLAAGGKVTGVIPHFMVEQNWHHTGLSELIEVNTMHERKQLMCEMSDAVISFPGGIGTAEELLETLTWKQLGLITKPIVIMNVLGCYDSLLTWLDQMVDGHFMREIHKNMWKVCAATAELDSALQSMPEWDSTVRKIAAI